MKSVQAARIHHYGGSEAIRIERITLPDPGPGQLVVRLCAAGVNPIDWKIRAGYMQKFMPLPLPFTLGGDFSGVVDQVGPGVGNVKVGDEVYGQAPVFLGGSGSFAEAVVAPVTNLAPRPRSIGHTEAGALPLAGVSALQALTEDLRVGPGQRVLIHAGAGGIGSLAIQLAKHLGAWVATTVSSRNLDYVKQLGADEVIDYHKVKFEDAVSEADAVLDTVGGETYQRSFRVLRRGGRLASFLERPREDLTGEFGVTASMLVTQVTTARLDGLAQLVEQGVLKVNIHRTFPLESTAAALHEVEKSSPRGKVVLQIE